jgi:2-octaprenylphenol hydroxylase
MSSRRNDFDCLVAGGGMVGLALAALISREPGLRGWRIGLIEPSPPPRLEEQETDLRVSALSRASQRVLQAAGAWDAIAQRASPYTRMVVWDAASEPDAADALRFDSAETGEPDLGHIAENSRVQAALLDSALLDGVTRFETSLEALDLQPGRARVTLGDGRQLSCRLLVGADGAASRCRELAGIGRAGWAYAQSAVVAQLRCERPHGGTAWQRFLPSGPVALLPLRDGSVSLVWSTSTEEAGELIDVDAPEFNRRVTEATGAVLGRLECCSRRAAFPLGLWHAKQYVRDGLALVGDAAHTIHPLAGQGANLGFLDAACLVEVLARAESSGEEPASLRNLRRYERWRRSENSLVMGFCDGINRLFGSRSMALASLRRTGMALVGGQSITRRALVQRALGNEGDLPAIARIHREGIEA